MNPFKALQGFFSSNVGDTLPPTSPFVQIKRDEWVKRHKLKERGVERGQMGQPPANATTFDDVENEILSAVGAELNGAQIFARDQVSAYDDRLSGLQLLTHLSNIRAKTAEAVGDFKTLVMEWLNEVELPTRDVRSSFSDLEDFKRLHGIRKPAKDVPPKIVTWGVIAIAGLFEVLANAVFLRVNDDLGYLGGIIGAIVVSAINIIFAYLFGRYLIPRKNLQDPIQKWIGLGSAALWAILALLWNLLAAHYRDAKFSSVPTPEIAAWEQLWANPAGLDGIFSLGILIMGLFVSVVVLVDAYKMDDPLPGYGEKSRDFQATCDAYVRKVAAANRELTGVRNDAIRGAEEVKRQLGLQLDERDRIAKAYERFSARFNEHLEYLEQEANYLLSVYRTENRKARSEPDPAHFGERYEISKIPIEPLHLPNTRDEDIEAAGRDLDACIAAVSSEFEASIEQFPALKELLRDLEDSHNGSV